MRLDVAVGSCNAAPVIRVRGKRTVSKGVPATIDARESSDANGDQLSFEWALTRTPPGSVAKLAGADSDRVTLTPDQSGAYNLELSLSDGELTSNSQLVLDVRNDPPVARAGDDLRADLGAPVTIDGAGSSDPNGDALTYTWALSGSPGASTATLASNGPRATFLPDQRGRYDLTLTVSDGELMATDTIVVQAGVSSSPPVANAGRDLTAEVDTVVSLDGLASSDPDGDTLTFDWSISSAPPNGIRSWRGEDTAQPSFIADVPGVYVFALAVNDGFYTSAADTVVVQVTPIAVGIGSAAACAGGNVLVLHGDERDDEANPPRPGDFIHPGYGQYATRDARGWAGTSSVSGRPSFVRVDVDPRGAFWIVEFEAVGTYLAPGVIYDDARRFPFNDDHHGLSIFGDGRGCNTLSGRFQIHELTVDTSTVNGDSILRSVTASFVQHCEMGTPELRGCLHFQQ